MNDTSKLQHVVIAGTEKAGTTSLFSYLSQHHDIQASKVKETDYFRSQEVTYDDYIENFFDAKSAQKKFLLEASPGYLSEAEQVALKMHQVLPDGKIIFILRNPIERLYSTWKFHVGRLNIDETISFDNYVKKCLQFDNSELEADALGIGEWYLRGLEQGKYWEKLEFFFKYYKSEQIKILFFNDLKKDTPAVVKEICEFIGINFSDIENISFRKENVTFSGKIKWLHKFSLKINSVFEPFFRRNVWLKHQLLDLYKKINGSQSKSSQEISNDTKQILLEYYQSSNEQIKNNSLSDSDILWV